MTYLYLLAGENLDLAEAELNGFLRSQEIEGDVERRGRLAETDSHPQQLKRLALTQQVSRKITETSVDSPEIDYTPKKSFAVRVENLSDREIDTKKLEDKVGQLLKTEDNEADLETPEEEIKAYVTDRSLVVGSLVVDIDRGLFQERSNEERPFSSPVSLDPVLARTLVNLSEVSKGEKLLDPFCGTGGILIEAGLCGTDVYGLDIQEEMVEGARRNLEKYGIINHDIRTGDIADIPEIFNEEFDAIVTDLPYGKASLEKEEPVEKFLDTLENFEGRAVFMYNESSIGGYSADFSIYMHKSLTRHIYVI